MNSIYFQSHCEKLARFVSEILTNLFENFTDQMNVITMFKVLHGKKYIQDEVFNQQFEQLLNARNELLPNLRANINFDTNDGLKIFMKLSAFARHQMFARDSAAQLCKRTNDLVMTNHLDLTQNRTFLGKKITFFFCFFSF